MSSLVTKADMFGEAVTINYKGSNTIKSFAGGLVTLISYMAVLIFSAFLVSRLVNNEATLTT